MKKKCNISDCPLFSRIEVPYSGNKRAPILMVGESPGRKEELQRKPFVGDTGDFIKSRVIDAGLFGRILWANAARCLIDKKEMPQKDITQTLKHCRPKLEKVLHTVQPKVVFLMGAFAMQQVLKKKGIKNNRGKWLWSKEFNCWCIATWHPGYIFRNRAHEPEFDQDFRMLVDFVNNGYQVPKDDDEKQYTEVTSIHDILELANTKRLVCGIDTEAQGLDWVGDNFVPVSYSISWAPGKAYHIQLYEEAESPEDSNFSIIWPRYITKKKKDPTEVYVKKADNFDQKLAELNGFLQHPNIYKVMQHGSFDQHVIDRLFTMNGLPRPQWVSYIADTQAQAHLIDENLYVMASLTQLQRSFTNIREDYDSQFSKAYDKSDMLAVPRAPLVYYACADADVTRQAFMGIWKRLKKHPRLVQYYKKFVHKSLNEIIYAMEHYGVAVDLENLPVATAEVKAIRDKHEQDALKNVPKAIRSRHEAKGLALTRRDIIRDALFDEEGYRMTPIKLTDSKQPSVDKDSLKELHKKARSKKAKALITEYQQFSEYDMLWSRYLKGYAKHTRDDGRTHPSISISAAATGRLGTKEPNNMAIPKRSKAAPAVRRLIVPREGYKFVLIDQSQSELRWLAQLSKDENMMAVFRNGEDIHTATATEIVRRMGKRWRELSVKEQKDMRNKAKPVNFGVIYLMSPPGLAQYAKSDYGMDMSERQAKEWMEALFRKYPKVPQYQNDTIATARRLGYVESPLGRRRRLPEINSHDKGLKGGAERQAVNFPIQNASSDMVLMSGNCVVEQRYPEDEIVPCLFIHDELVFEVREDCIDQYVPSIKYFMENPPLEDFGIDMKVPLVAEPKIGDNAADTKEYEMNCN